MPEQRARRSAVIATIDLPPGIERLRYAETADARRGIPAHVTVLFPFVAPPEINEPLLTSVARAVQRVPAFEVTFAAVHRWPAGESARQGVVWLAPEPEAPFRSLTDELVLAFPAYPPYEGRHAEVIPHLTIATDRAERFDGVEAEAARHLPITRAIDAVGLYVEGFDGQWRLRARFGLAEEVRPAARTRRPARRREPDSSA